MMEEAVAILARTPATLDALLRGLQDDWIAAHEGGSTWSPFDVVGHLIHGERTDWIPRARIILAHGEAKPFEKFDRLAQFQESEGRTLASRLDEFAALREENLQTVDSLHLAIRSRSTWATSGAWRGDAAPAACHVGCTRPRSHCADLASTGQAICGRSWPVASLSADHQRYAGLTRRT
jgi:DinB family protein